MMRIAIDFLVEGPIPLDYRLKGGYSLIKEAIRLSEPGYYDRLFSQERYEIKPFSFAVFFKNFELKNDQIFAKQLSITISSPSIEFSVNALNGIRKLKTHKVENSVWRQISVRLLKEAIISSNKVVLSTLSPILIENKQGKPLAPHDEQYEQELNYFANLLMQRVAGRPLMRPVQFTPIRMEKVVVKESNREFDSANPDQYLFFTTYKGMFRLEGHREDLQYLYQTGIGKRTVYFGLTELVREEV